MDRPALLSPNLLLFLSLTLQLTYQTDEKCFRHVGRLGENVSLPLTVGGNRRSMNSSMYILVTRDKSQGDLKDKRKILSFHQPAGSNSQFQDVDYKFHADSLSLEILKSRREHEGPYFITMEGNVSVQQFCLKLKLYEPVSTPEIQVLNLTQKDNCSLTLFCQVRKGDQVAISWSTVPPEPSLTLVNDSQILNLTLGPQHTIQALVCTASNPISQEFQTFIPAPHCSQQSAPTSWKLYLGLSFGCLVCVIIILIVALQRLQRRGNTDNYQSNQDSKNLTIYAQVQKAGSAPSRVEPTPVQEPCTTIYVAAMEPIQEPAHIPDL